MARRNVRKTKNKTGKSWRGRLVKWMAATCFTVACFVAAHYIYDYLKWTDWNGQISRLGEKFREKLPDEPLDVSQKELESLAGDGIKKAQEAVADVKESFSEQKVTATQKPVFPKDVELPVLLQKRTEQIIRHEGYTVSYNSDYRIANWVAYELTDKEASSTEYSRQNKFCPDPEVKGASALNEDYSNTGFDRGHLAPAGDMKWSMKAMQESFYFSNICPQRPKLNRGVWRELEEQCRLWAKENGVLYVATGPVIQEKMRRMGKNRVGVPSMFYKVLCTVVDGKYEAIGFLFENKNYKGNETMQQHIVTVDSVEVVTGIDFFPALPDEIEDKIEAVVNSGAWSF